MLFPLLRQLLATSSAYVLAPFPRDVFGTFLRVGSRLFDQMLHRALSVRGDGMAAFRL